MAPSDTAGRKSPGSVRSKRRGAGGNRVNSASACYCENNKDMGKIQEQFSRLNAETADEIAIPVLEEDVTAGVKPVKTGAVRVEKHVEKRLRKVETPLVHENLEIRRVPVNRIVKEMPGIRRQGETIIIPVVEEELVVSKRLVVREEVHLIRHRTKGRVTKEVTLHREIAKIHRLDADGRRVDRDPQPESGRRRRRPSLLT